MGAKISIRELTNTQLQARVRCLAQDSGCVFILDHARLRMQERSVNDKEVLRRYYLKNGYADFQVVSAVAQLTPDGRDFFLTFTVEEGERYRFGAIDVVSRIPELDPDILRSVITTKQGDIFNATEHYLTTRGLATSTLDRETPRVIKGVLRDQSTIAGIGNAYSDEILHAARLSPFHPCNTLTTEQVTGLYAAMRDELTGAIDNSIGHGTGTLKSEKKANLSVHGRPGQACPVCGDAGNWHSRRHWCRGNCNCCRGRSQRCRSNF